MDARKGTTPLKRKLDAFQAFLEKIVVGAGGIEPPTSTVSR